MADDSKTQAAAVYVGWATFKNALDSLAQGIPNIVDRSAFTGLSGGVQSQLLAGLKFLGLINDAGHPTPDLHELAVLDEQVRKAKLTAILKARYSAIFALGLEKMTTGQLDSAMADSYNVTGDTREKAVRFFLSAVQYTGLPVSRFLQPKGSSPGSNGVPRRRPTARPRSVPPAVKPVATGPVDSSTGTGESLTISLRSGGTLTVTASIAVFKLLPEDRTFVFEVIDKLRAYEQPAPLGEDEDPDEDTPEDDQ